MDASSAVSALQNRRNFLLASSFSSSSLLFASLPARAAVYGLGQEEIDQGVTQAVTTSDLGVSVRKGVVRGAQVMDKIDERWEAFSDRYHLGLERQKRPGRPPPKVIPSPHMLDATFASQLIELGDQVFVSLYDEGRSSSSEQLKRQVEKVATTVVPAFARSSPLSLSVQDLLLQPSNIRTGEELNFVAYCHFKAYSDLLLRMNSRIDFGRFKRQFEQQLGSQVLSLLLPTYLTDGSGFASSSCRIRDKLPIVEVLCRALVDKGLVASIDVSSKDAEDVNDFCNDDSGSIDRLAFSVGLDGDVTLPTQVLLQEQGVRLYPNYARFAMQALLGDSTTQTTIMDYYMDTDYNSDPAKFQVKEVLMNIEIESLLS